MALSQVSQTVSYIQNGISSDVVKVPTAFRNTGVSMPIKCRFDIVPLATAVGFISAANAVVANVPVPLNVANTVPFLGQTVVQLDCQRCPLITFSAPSTSATIVTVVGYDDRNIPVIATSGALAVGTESYYMAKAFSKVASVTFTASPGAGITAAIGNGQVIGLPYFLGDIQMITSIKYNNITLDPTWAVTNNAAPNLAPAVLATAGFPWRTTGTATPRVPPTAASTDARGLIAVLPLTAPTPPGAAAGAGAVALAPFDGAVAGGVATGLMLSVEYYVYGADSYVDAQLNNNVVSAQALVGGVFGTANSVPALVYADLVGWQYPGDLNYSGTPVNART